MNPIGTVEPSDVAANIVDAMHRGRDYVFTDDHDVGEVDARLQAMISPEPTCRARLISTSARERLTSPRVPPPGERAARNDVRGDAGLHARSSP